MFLEIKTILLTRLEHWYETRERFSIELTCVSFSMRDFWMLPVKRARMRVTRMYLTRMRLILVENGNISVFQKVEFKYLQIRSLRDFACWKFVKFIYESQV